MGIASGQKARIGLFSFLLIVIVALPGLSRAAPYASMVMDARTGEVLYSRNADTPLHPASLTKMMTLYVAFEAVEHGEISLDTKVLISKKAASEPPSKLGLKAGQRIALRYLIRAAAVKSANDAATAIGEAISGSEAAFARRMNRTARALGMSRTKFKNAHGLTESGHLSTARDMTVLGRHIFYDYPEYYNLFSRRSTHAGLREVSNTNRRFLNAYAGADGIKTGYTSAAGFNLVASAERGSERIITTVFGGRSTASRNAHVAELMDLGFKKAPRQAAVRKPGRPSYVGDEPSSETTVTAVVAVARSPRPVPRPSAPEPDGTEIAARDATIDETLALALTDVAADTLPAVPEVDETPVSPTATLPSRASASPPSRPVAIRLAAEAVAEIATVPDNPSGSAGEEVVTRLSTSGGRHWGISIGKFGSRYQAERMLIETALLELGTLDDALRKVVQRSGGFEANFVGLSAEQADLACRRLSARNLDCSTVDPG